MKKKIITRRTYPIGTRKRERRRYVYQLEWHW